MPIISLQYLFKPQQMSPGLVDGQEACVYKRLTDYAQELELPFFVIQCWEGKGKDSTIVNYAIIDKNTKQILFMDPRTEVCEYILETYAEKLEENQNVEST